MPRVSQLPQQSPSTVEALRQILTIEAIDARLTAAEAVLSANTASIVLPATVVAIQEDAIGSGDLFTSASTTSGVLRVLEYYISGVIGAFPAGLAATIPGVGEINLYADGEWTFEPGANYNGTVPEVTFVVTNGTTIRLSRLAITVGAVNDPVVATPDGAMTAINSPVTIDILGNDYDPENSTVTLLDVNNNASIGTSFAVPHGNVVVNQNRSITFTPDTDYAGQTSFNYRVSDGVQTTIGQVNIQVGFENIGLFSPVLPIFSGSYFDEANLHFGYTAMQWYGPEYDNGVDVSYATYSNERGNFDFTMREPWLYDRATQIYKLYLRTGDQAIRAKALELAEIYMAGVTVNYYGADFTVGNGTPGDPKYLYPIIAWWYERETGNAIYRAKAHGLYTQAKASFPIAYSTGTATWTERNMNYTLQACLANYWITGDQTCLTDAEAYFATLVSMSVETGAPLHPLTQHEGTGGTTPITSTWMGALLAETLIQLYRTNGDTEIVSWIARYCDFVMANGFYLNNEIPGFLGQSVPAYLVGVGFQQREQSAEYDSEHCFDVAQLLKKGIWAKKQLNQSTTAMEAMVQDLLIAARFVFDSWTRIAVGLPKYRVNPPRKLGWWFNGAYSELYFAGVVPLGPINQTPPMISGLSPVGSVLTATTGAWIGNPTFAYQWRRFSEEGGTDVAIAGATNSTYTTTNTDNPQQVYCAVTAENAGGRVTRLSNRILVTTQGSPVITTQPDNTVAASGDNATFTVAVIGDAPLTYEWSVSTDAGNIWSVVSGGSADTLIITNVNAPMSGYRYQCRVSNSNGLIISNPATLFVTSQLNAVQFNASEGAALTSAIFQAAASNFTLEAVVSFGSTRISGRNVFTNRYVADRTVSVGIDPNSYPDYNLSLGDSQTAFSTGALPINPTNDVWYLLTLSGDSVADTGLFRATIQELGGGTLHSVSRDKGIDGNLTHVACEINGGGVANSGLNSMKFQYVRAFNTQRTLTQIGNDRNDVNVQEALFWWVFEDNGAGGVAVRDATGNNRVPIVTGGILAAGPVVPVV